MKAAPLLAATALATAAASAHADAYDCFPTCAQETAAAQEAAALRLCENALVREAVRVDVETRPLREVIGIVTNPTGFVLKQVNDHVVHIPKWVGFVIDPKAALRSEVMKRVRAEARKAAGIEHDCRVPAEDAGPDEAVEAYSATI
jgi:hypothetical protein